MNTAYTEAETRPAGRSCTQCTFLIPISDPYRMCKVCRMEARERARKRRVRTSAPEYKSQSKKDASQDDAIYNHEHTMLTRKEYRQIESDQNIDLNLGRKRMRLTQGLPTVPGISYADFFGSAQELSDAPENLQSNAAHSALTRDLTNYSDSAASDQFSPSKASSSSAFEDSGMNLATLLGRATVHRRFNDIAKTPPPCSHSVDVSIIDLCSPELSYPQSTSATLSAPILCDPPSAHYASSSATPLRQAQHDKPTLAVTPNADDRFSGQHIPSPQSLKRALSTSADLYADATAPAKKKRRPRVPRLQPEPSLLRQHSAPVPSIRKLAPYEPAQPPSIPAPRSSFKSISNASRVAPSASSQPSTSSGYPWPYSYWAPNYYGSASQQAQVPQKATGSPSGPPFASPSGNSSAGPNSALTPPSSAPLASETQTTLAPSLPASWSSEITRVSSYPARSASEYPSRPTPSEKPHTTPTSHSHVPISAPQIKPSPLPEAPGTPASTPAEDAVEACNFIDASTLNAQLMNDLRALLEELPTAEASAVATNRMDFVNLTTPDFEAAALPELDMQIDAGLFNTLDSAPDVPLDFGMNMGGYDTQSSLSGMTDELGLTWSTHWMQDDPRFGGLFASDSNVIPNAMDYRTSDPEQAAMQDLEEYFGGANDGYGVPSDAMTAINDGSGYDGSEPTTFDNERAWQEVFGVQQDVDWSDLLGSESGPRSCQ